MDSSFKYDKNPKLQPEREAIPASPVSLQLFCPPLEKVLDGSENDIYSDSTESALVYDL